MSVKANELTNQTSLAATDRLLGVAPSTNAGFSIDYTVLAKKIIEEYTGSTVAGSAQTLQAALNSLNSNVGSGAGYHNSIYRGKSLGTSVTAAQYAAIKAGTFDDMFVGDYWTISTTFSGEVDGTTLSSTKNVVYRIAGFDYWYNNGDTNTTAHHVVLVPDANLYSAKMNDTNTTTGAYVGSLMYTTNILPARTGIADAFGSAHILSHRVLLKNAVTSGYASGYEWASSTVDLMSEKMVYGTQIYSAMPTGSTIPSQYTVDKSQLPLFALEPSRISNRAHWWLRSVGSSANFAGVSSNGSANYNGASASCGVRPAFAIYQS